LRHRTRTLKMARLREARTPSGETARDASSASGTSLVSSCSSIRLTYFALFVTFNRVLTALRRITSLNDPISTTLDKN
jgi:hypothetical protein